MPGAIFATNFESAVADERDLVLGGGAVVDEQRDVDRLGGARDAQDLAAHAVLADDEGVGAEALDRFALLVDGADEQRALARPPACERWCGVTSKADERSQRTRDGKDHNAAECERCA